MKELGAYLRETRISNGVSIDEAAQDLNIDDFLLESIEEGNTRSFKDILVMKEKVKEYTKYLGLKSEEVMDEFNDYLFEKTSKISLQDIIDAEKGATKGENNKISSPYTAIKPKKKDKKIIFYIIGGLCIFVLLVLLLFIMFKPKKNIIVEELKSLKEGDLCELA